MSGTDFLQFLDSIPSFGLRCCLASSVVTLAMWGVVWRLRSHSAALRHRVLCLGLAGVVVLPILVVFSQGTSPTLHVRARKPLVVVKPYSVDGGQREASNLPVSNVEPFADVQDTAPAVPDAHSEMMFALPDDFSVSQSSSPVATTKPGPQYLEFVWPAIPLSSLPFVIWTLVAIGLAVRTVVDRFFLKRLLHGAIEVTDERALQMLQTIARDQKICGVKLVCSDALQVPVATGMLRSAIVLPTGYGKWSDDRLHIGRSDVLAQSVARLACILFWFNPLVWQAASRMRLERELASDDSVLRSGKDAVDYADHLVAIAEGLGLRSRIPAGVSAMATHTDLHSRITRLTQTEIDRSQPSRAMSAALFLLAAAFITCLSLATPSIAMTPDDSVTATDSRIEATITGNLDADWLEKLKAVPNLERLTIRDPKVNFRAGQLIELTNIRWLHVEDLPLGTPMADMMMANVAQMTGLREVTFKATGLTHKGLRLIKNSSITSLSLIDEELMTDEGFRHVGKMSSLKKLSLDGTPIQATGLEHLSRVASLQSFTLLVERRVPKLLPVIARFPVLEELELFKEAYPDLVVLKQAKSLRRLTLRHCGAFKASESLEQLVQLDRIELDNADIRHETFDEVSLRLSKAGIEVVDITRAANIPSTRTPPPNEATKLARKVHREMDFAKKHPELWISWRNSHGEIASMKQEPIRTLHRLKIALNEPSVPAQGNYDSNAFVMAWSRGQFYHEAKFGKDDQVAAEYYKYGDETLAWASERYRAGEPTRRFLRNGAADFAGSLNELPPTLKVALQSYWWGTGKLQWTDPNVATSPYSAHSVTYEELKSEEFDGEQCHVVQSAMRHERLWISKTTGRLKAVLTFGLQGFRTPFHKQPIVTEIVGHSVETTKEYHALIADGSTLLSKARIQQLNLARSEYVFENAVPWKVYEFDDYREIATGSWYPFKVRTAGWHHGQQSEHYDFYNTESVVKEVRTECGDLHSVWQPLLPKDGVKIQDQRFAVPIEYEYRQDRTIKEIEELASEAIFEKARSAMSWAKRLSPLNEMLGKPAVDLPAGGWLGERPVLKGKPYLLHFWGTWCGPCKNDIPWLNEIAKNSIVIGVHPSGTAEDEIREAMASEKMDYPTIVSTTDLKKPLGYPVSMYPYCIKVDEHGIVVKHGLLRDVLGTTPPVAGNKDVSANPLIVGRVVATNPEYSLFQLTLGTKDGIEPQQMLDVMRDGKRIGKLRVVLAMENQSVAKADRKEDGDRVKVGSTVQH